MKQITILLCTLLLSVSVVQAQTRINVVTGVNTSIITAKTSNQSQFSKDALMTEFGTNIKGRSGLALGMSGLTHIPGYFASFLWGIQYQRTGYTSTNNLTNEAYNVGYNYVIGHANFACNIRKNFVFYGGFYASTLLNAKITRTLPKTEVTENIDAKMSPSGSRSVRSINAGLSSGIRYTIAPINTSIGLQALYGMTDIAPGTFMEAKIKSIQFTVEYCLNNKKKK